MYLRGFVLAAALLGCSSGKTGDAVIVDARVDGRVVDARMIDARMIDAGVRDARMIDARMIDARMIDARMIDARMPDARMPDARMPDARMPDARIIDARVPDATVFIDAGTRNVVSCYTEGDPAQSCTLPEHCCFSNYSSQHDGQCSNNACLYGTISCDGPEDCGGGQHCCSQPLFDSGGALDGYSLACQATACGTAPGDHELCHIGGAACSNGGTCVTAYLHANDLPRTLDICQ
jgi:hypothetical protein